jgi:transcriptional regulator with XRE-family HTH domain
MSKFYQPTPREVKEARLFAKLTQSESAELCLITSNTWARYEQGLTQMPAPIWKLFEYAIAHRDASQSIKANTKANKDTNVATAEEKAFFEELLSDWKTPEQYEADNWVYPEGHRLYHTNPKPRE